MPCHEKSPSPSAMGRLIALIQLIAREPGLSFDELKQALDESTAKQGGWGKSTLLKDIAQLKSWGLLDAHRHRQGYFLTGAHFSLDELQTLMDGMRLQAEALGCPVTAPFYSQLRRRLRAATPTPPFPLIALGKPAAPNPEQGGERGLSECLKQAMLRGQMLAVRLPESGRELELYPLQFVRDQGRWHLLAENGQDGCFRTIPLAALGPTPVPLGGAGRGNAHQRERQAIARQVMEQGWGVVLPPHGADGSLSVPFLSVCVRFKPRAASDILAAEPKRSRRLADGGVQWTAELPHCPRVLDAFKHWILTWGASAEVLTPGWLREALRQEALHLLTTYEAPQAS